MAALPAGMASGVGSMPGENPAESASIIVGELGFGHVAELPARGPGADMIGRSAAFLVDMSLDLVGNDYQLSAANSRITQRAKGFLSADLDALEEAWHRSGLIGSGQPCKIAACGPFTLAGAVALRGGHKLVHDRGAWNDVLGSLAEGLAAVAADLERRLGAAAVIQLDEPLVDRVIAGRITPLTRLDVNPPIPAPDVAQALSELVAHVGRPAILHHCGAEVPWELLHNNTFDGLSVDFSRIGEAAWDELGQYLDAGRTLVAGLVPTGRPVAELPVERVVEPLVRTLDGIGLSRDVLARQVIVTPACGLAGADPQWAAHALRLCSQAAAAFADDPSAL
ncbi:hypothetical protein [Jongsikchunia kroppenstedtii]|uniref:hypothetical protein n=1 Tax=Jongsikchunia kroppenstedtii TaxID=1121721 RepID=UPI000381B0F6|nr:hypothetical protein [Jongsikchunia kroppenstedtii]